MVLSSRDEPTLVFRHHLQFQLLGSSQHTTCIAVILLQYQFRLLHLRFILLQFFDVRPTNCNYNFSYSESMRIKKENKLPKVARILSPTGISVQSFTQSE